MSEAAPRPEGRIRTILVPHLRQDGFSGTGQTFRRLVNGWIQVVNVQASRRGGQFAINLGLQPLAIPDVMGNKPDPNTITQELCEFRTRLSESGPDQWWKHHASSSSMDAALSAAADVYVRIGRPLLNEMCSATSPIATVSPEDFEIGNFDFRGFRSTEVRMALALARLRKVEGKLSDSRSFAARGLAKIGPAVALKRALEVLCLTE